MHHRPTREAPIQDLEAKEARLVVSTRPRSARMALAALACLAVTVPVAGALRQSDDCGPIQVADDGSDSSYGPMAPGEVIVKFHDDVPSKQRATILCDVGAVPERTLATGADLLEVVDEQGDPATPRLLVAVVTELESRPEVEYAVPNEIVDTQSSGDNVF